MVALPKTKMSASEFLVWSATRSRKYELENGEVVEMAAEKARHALMKHAATVALEAGIRSAGLACAVFPDGMTVVVDDAHVRLPDASIQCSPVMLDDTVLEKPVVLVEVTSPSSVYRDEAHKLLEYFSVPSVEHYLLLSPDERRLVHFKRGSASGQIDTTIMREGRLDLDPPGFSVDVAELLGQLPPNVLS